MRRSYFMPMVVLGGFLLLCGVASVVMVIAVQPWAHSVQERSWEADFKNGTDYGALYDATVALLQKQHSEHRDHVAFTGATGTMIGGLLIWWALDRRRLLKNANMGPQETTCSRPAD